MASSTSNVGGSVSQQLLDTMNGTSSSSSSSTSTGNATSDLQNTFLTLLVTQLKNQDPTNPMDSSQMTSQLAQINTVTGISQLNTTLTSLASQLSASQNANTALLIGQDVLVPGNTTSVSNGTSPGFGVQLANAVSDLTITVKDKSGNVVSSVDLGAQSAGTIPVGWTPTDSSGNKLPDGTYTISAAGKTSTGATATGITTLAGSVVASVVQQSSGKQGLLLQNGSTVDSTSVVAIL
ncbi:basal-body rod modification protein FlgD [Trinickia caryophylli]|uniref:Basal-body rod modification protein FlgD n=1 Tax=Trinickia caryophylli TaxID=28094 RepID=A0A1X7FGK2_TRICW|nr:basal-body rod modification protein FlgD [Trinickia caryophylli]SMF51733.1 flagellar basal-body rod modification protein FlgD [Trinickia caryophylli]